MDSDHKAGPEHTNIVDINIDKSYIYSRLKQIAITPDIILPVVRGGMVFGTYLAHYYQVDTGAIFPKSTVIPNDTLVKPWITFPNGEEIDHGYQHALVVEDVLDTGETLEQLKPDLDLVFGETGWSLITLVTKPVGYCKAKELGVNIYPVYFLPQHAWVRFDWEIDS